MRAFGIISVLVGTIFFAGALSFIANEKHDKALIRMSVAAVIFAIAAITFVVRNQ